MTNPFGQRSRVASTRSPTRSLVAILAVFIAFAGALGASSSEAWAANNPGTGDTGFFTFPATSPDESVKVNVASGNLLIDALDLGDDTSTYHVTLGRYYNSLAPSTDGIFGPRWTVQVDPKVQIIDQGATAVIAGPTGSRITATKDSDGHYILPNDFNGQLTRTASGWTFDTLEYDTYLFDSSGALASVTDRSGRRFTVQGTSAAGKPVLSSYGDQNGRRLNISYTGDAHVREIDDPASGHHMYGYTSGRLTSKTGPGGGQETYGYDSAGFVNRIQESSGDLVETTNDSQGRVTNFTITPSGGSATTTIFNYSVPGQTTVTNPDGSSRVYTYDDDWRVAPDRNLSWGGQGDPGFFSFIDIGGGSGARVNVASGNLLVSATDLPSRTTQTPLRRVYNSLVPDAQTAFGGRWRYSLDASVAVKSHADGSADVAGPDTDVIPADLNEEASGGYDLPYGYDGALIGVANGAYTLQRDDDSELRFDGSGRLVSTATPDGDTSTVSYAPQAGRQALSTYVAADGYGIAVTYGPDGRAQTISDNATNAATYYYDSQRRLSGVGGPSGHTAYTYDTIGRLATITPPSGGTYTIASDSVGRVRSITNASAVGVAQAWTFDYADPHATTVTDSSGATRIYQYDDNGRVEDLAETASTLPEDEGAVDEPDSGLPSVTVPQGNYDQTDDELIPVPNDPLTTLLEDDDGSSPAARGFFPRRYVMDIEGPKKDDPTRPPGGDWATIRNVAGSFMIGNGTDGTKFVVRRKVPAKATGPQTYFGRLYGHNNGCGWISAGALSGGKSSSDPDCANNGPRVRKFAKLINCDQCNAVSRVTLRDGVAKAPIYRNARPYAKHSAGKDFMFNFEGLRSNGQKATLGWRYQTRDGNYVAIASSSLGHGTKGDKGDRWGFMRKSDLAELCPKRPAGKRPTYKKHQDWPNVCIIGKQPKK